MKRAFSGIIALSTFIGLTSLAVAQSTVTTPPSDPNANIQSEPVPVPGSAAKGAGSGVPDRSVGNNPAKGTDDKGTVMPPARDKDARDALKKLD